MSEVLLHDREMLVLHCSTPFSSMIESFAFTGPRDGVGDLRIRFNNNEVYVYNQVPASIAIEMAASDSVGKTFIDKVKSAGFTYSKLM